MATVLGDLVWRITGNTTDFTKKIRDANKGVNNFAASAAKTTAVIGGAFVAAGAAAGAAAFKLARDAGEAADRLLDLEQITGLSTDNLQRFEFVAADAGVSFEGLVNSTQRFASRIPQIINGTGASAEAFESLGVSLTDANGELRDQNDLFPETIKALQNIENVTERNATAQQLFGRSLSDLAPVLGLTNDQFDDLFDAADATGSILSREALEGANQFRAALDTLNVQLNNARTQLGATLAPILNVLVDSFGTIVVRLTAAASQFQRFATSVQGAASIGVFVGNIAASLDAIGTAAQLLFDPIKEAIEIAIEPFQQFAAEGQQNTVVFDILGGVIQVVASGLRILAILVKGAVDNLIALGRVVQSVGDLAGAFGQLLRDPRTWNEFKEQVASTGDAFKDFGNGLVGNAADVIKQVGEEFTNFNAGAADNSEKLLTRFEETSQRIADSTTAALVAAGENGLGDAPNTVQKDVDEIIGVIEDADLSTTFGDIADDIEESFEQAFGRAAQSARRFFGAITDLADARADRELELLRREVETAEEGTAERIRLQEQFDTRERQLQRQATARKKRIGIFNATIDTAAAIIGFLADPGGIPGIILSAAASAAGLAQIAAIASEPLPALQSGGIVPARPGGRVVRVAEGGEDEAIIPLDRADMFGPMRIVINLDGTPIAAATVDRINRRELIVDAGAVR